MIRVEYVQSGNALQEVSWTSLAVYHDHARRIIPVKVGKDEIFKCLAFTAIAACNDNAVRSAMNL